MLLTFARNFASKIMSKLYSSWDTTGMFHYSFLFFKNAEFYVSANNIFTMTDYLGYDPEFAYSQSQIYQGVDYGLTPHARQFIVGIKIGL